MRPKDRGCSQRTRSKPHIARRKKELCHSSSVQTHFRVRTKRRRIGCREAVGMCAHRTSIGQLPVDLCRGTTLALTWPVSTWRRAIKTKSLKRRYRPMRPLSQCWTQVSPFFGGLGEVPCVIESPRPLTTTPGGDTSNTRSMRLFRASKVSSRARLLFERAGGFRRCHPRRFGGAGLNGRPFVFCEDSPSPLRVAVCVPIA